MFYILKSQSLYTHNSKKETGDNIRHANLVFIGLFMIVLLSSLVHAFSPETNNNIATVIDVIGIIAGITLLIIVIRSLKSFSGSLRKSYDYMLCMGILFQILALLGSLVFLKLKLFEAPSGIDLHHLLMAIGFVFFGIAAYKIRVMANTINKKG